MHAAMITKLVDIQAIKGADRIVSAGVHNGAVVIARVIVGIQHSEGEVGIYFAPDLQLSEEYCRVNDLIARYDETGTKIGGGYFNEKRRVVAQRFKGVKSEGLWMPLASTEYAYGFGAANKSLAYNYTLGDLITEINGHELCKKYISLHTRVARDNNKNRSLDRFVLDFPKHKDTDQLIHEIGNIPSGADIIITEKLHGTSHRKGLVLNKTNLPWYKKFVNLFAKLFGKEIFATEEYQITHGTRNVVISAGKIGFHGSEDFRYACTAGGDLYPDEIVYGEIVGYANGKSIMPAHATSDVKEIKKVYGDSVTYHYGCGVDECRFFVYRITRKVNGVWADLLYDDMAHRAHELGYLFIPTLRRFTYDGNPESLMNVVKELAEPNGVYAQSIYANHPAEGVVVRVEKDGLVTSYKYKSFGFKVLEGILKANDDSIEIEEIS